MAAAPKLAAVTGPVLSERLQQLLADTAMPTPYPVTDSIVVAPPTKRRRDDMRDAQIRVMASQQLLNQIIEHAFPPRPAYPDMPAAPPATATAKHLAAYQSAVEGFDKLVANWETLNAAWDAEVARHQEAIENLAAKIAEDSSAYTRALFGGSYQAVIDFFDDHPIELWEAFNRDVQKHFGLIADTLPDDGTCAECGHVVDAEQAGKAPTPST